MHSAKFDYARPDSIDEAIRLLAEDENARALAGGHSLLPVMKLRQASPSKLIDLTRIEELTGIEEEGDSLRIGAMTTHSELTSSGVVRGRCRILADTAGLIGDVQVRNMGTLGGSVAHADPAADLPTALVALGATIHVRGDSGSREIPAREFFRGLFATALEHGELITAIGVPALEGGRRGAYLKHEHPASGYAVVGVAAILSTESGSCSDVAVAIGGVTGAPVLAEGVISSVEGQPPTDATFSAAAARVGEALSDPLGDLYASGEYRVHLAEVLTRRALTAASV